MTGHPVAGVCSCCGRVRCAGQWVEVEAGLSLERNTICPACRLRLYPHIPRRAA